MNASRIQKFEAQLKAIEAELLGLLKETLPRIAKSGEMLFFNSHYLPTTIQSHWLPKESEGCLSLSKQAILLRTELGEPLLGSIGQLYLAACSESSDTANEHRRGPRQLATWLIGELKLSHD